MKKIFLSIAACGVLALGAAACGGDDDSGGSSGSSGGDLSGTIRIDGSSTVGPFAQAAAEEFQGQNPNVKVTVGIAGTGGGFEKFCAGETDISDASRPIEPDEADICKKNGVTYKQVQVADDGISVVTNKSMTVDCMTTKQLKELWNEGSKVKKLSEIDPKFPDTELSLFGPDTDSGTMCRDVPSSAQRRRARSTIVSTRVSSVDCSGARASSQALTRAAMALVALGSAATRPMVAWAPALRACSCAASTVAANASIGSCRSSIRVVPAWLGSPVKSSRQRPCGQIAPIPVLP